jgi:hypothetical protein
MTYSCVTNWPKKKSHGKLGNDLRGMKTKEKIRETKSWLLKR